MKTFSDLKVWQKAHQFTLSIYRLTQGYPYDEKFGLVSQLRRSAASVATNLAEGNKRRSAKDFARFVNLSEASLEETKYSLLLSRDLGHLTQQEYNELMETSEEIGKMLNGLHKNLAAYSL